MTGHEAYLKLVFRVPGKPFKQDLLAAKLALRPLSDTPGLEGFSRDEKRVEVGTWPGAQYVVVIVHKTAEIDTPAFREFLSHAIAAFKTRQQPTAAGVEASMPWKKDGEKWHLSDKGFPPGRGARWDRTLLPKLLKIVRDVEPDAEVKWDNRDAILIKVPGATKSWARWRTKDADALDVQFVGRRGQFNLSRIEQFGRGAELIDDRAGGATVMHLQFVTADHFHAPALKQLLTEHLAGFREAHGKDKEAG
jgi:excinuclease ABC subunit A